jgi:hypothetical protein
MLKTLRLTPVGELERGEVVRLGQRAVAVDRTPKPGVLAYRGARIAVVYVSGRSFDGPARLVVLASETVIAGRRSRKES